MTGIGGYVPGYRSDGSAPPGVLAPKLDPLSTMSDAMRAMVLPALRAFITSWGDGREPRWTGDPMARGTYVGEIAAKLDIRPMSVERTTLQDTLSRLAEVGFLRYEYNRDVDTQLRFFISEAGEKLALER